MVALNGNDHGRIASPGCTFAWPYKKNVKKNMKRIGLKIEEIIFLLVFNTKITTFFLLYAPIKNKNDHLPLALRTH